MAWADKVEEIRKAASNDSMRPTWRVFAAILLLPVILGGCIAGFCSEMFMIGYRAGREMVEELETEASRVSAARRKRQ